MNTCYAIYRQPEEGDRCSLVEAAQARRVSVEAVDCVEGFLIAPFNVTATEPVVLIEGKPRPFCLNELPLAPDGGKETRMFPRAVEEERQAYHRQFGCFHKAIEDGMLEKVILSRISHERSAEATDPRLLFKRACRRFPHCFIALFHTPQTGTWLTATPEVLVAAHGGEAHTMALAGTMAAPSNKAPMQPWSEKNRREQRYVADYIRGQLASLGVKPVVSEPYTFAAGNVAHLRSDFSFPLPQGKGIGEVVRLLHPTPAVCGVPSKAARDFILQHEEHLRRYYSGYCGPIGRAEASLYVMLRCMNIRHDHYDLYAGGGLIADSTEQEEWEETENKLYAMRATLRGY